MLKVKNKNFHKKNSTKKILVDPAINPGQKMIVKSIICRIYTLTLSKASEGTLLETNILQKFPTNCAKHFTNSLLIYVHLSEFEFITPDCRQLGKKDVLVEHYPQACSYSSMLYAKFC